MGLWEKLTPGLDIKSHHGLSSRLWLAKLRRWVLVGGSVRVGRHYERLLGYSIRRVDIWEAGPRSA